MSHRTVRWDDKTIETGDDVMCVMYMSSSRIFPLSRYSICVKLEKQKFLPSCLVFVHSWHLFLVFIPDILAGSCWNKKFISFQKSNLLKLKRRIVHTVTFCSTNILILWRLSNLLPCFYGFIISGAETDQSQTDRDLVQTREVRGITNKSLIFSKHYWRQWLRIVSWRRFWTEGRS